MLIEKPSHKEYSAEECYEICRNYILLCYRSDSPSSRETYKLAAKLWLDFAVEAQNNIKTPSD